jgi:hypothetical protein
MILSDKVYKICKWLCLICLPALAVFYFTLSKIWGLPYGAEIPATINAVAVLIGALIGISQINLTKEAQDNDQRSDRGDS